ncbi:MAG: hypothetical protein WBF77_08785 [Sulfurimonadaceae bacterium]
MKNVVSSLFVLLILSGCENRAEPVEEETQVAPQEQHEQGHIETHSTE